MSDLLETLQQEGVDPALLEAVQQYRTAHALPDALRPRIPSPAFTYYGKQVWEQALAALLCGENLLLAGGNATGQKVIAKHFGSQVCVVAIDAKQRQAEKPPAKTCWPRTLPPPLAVPHGTSPSM